MSCIWLRMLTSTGGGALGHPIEFIQVREPRLSLDFVCTLVQFEGEWTLMDASILLPLYS